MPSLKFLNTGAIQTYTIPVGLSEMKIKVWGAAGGPNMGLTSYAGCGGYSQGNLNVIAGQVFQIMVGSVGVINNGTTSSYGGGGPGGNDATAGPGAQGGGRSGVAIGAGTQFIIAGGGGGAGRGSGPSINLGGNGGGLSGNNETIITGGTGLTPAAGGTQTAGGAGGKSATVPSVNGFAGTSLQGGKGGNGGGGGGAGGGGGGFFGGGGGSSAFGNDAPPEQAGGGGSAYLDTTLLRNALTLVTAQGTAGGVVNPPNTSDPDYIAGIGVANSTAGTGKGLVVFALPDLILTKSVDKTFATSGDVLNYTISIRNTGPGTVSGINFLDTIPGATTFVSNSLQQDGTAISGSPASPGVNLPNPLGENQVTTITFSVNVTGSSPNPANNQAIASYSNGAFKFSSNIVSTTIIGAAALTSTKTASKTFAVLGDTITYNIVTKNTGSITASNVLFIDTIPNGTTLVPSSFKQDTTNISGSPNPPGVNLPNSIGPGITSTITFQVVVSTIPNPNPIPNNALMTYSYSNGTSTITKSSSTNTVNTQVNFASLDGITKGVSETIGIVGDILTYVITIPNSGTTTATNILFKDTIPNGTSFIPNSVFVNGVNQIGSVVAPPTGISIPNIGENSFATLSFQVIVATIPSPNPIPNSGNIGYSYVLDPSLGITNTGSANTNIVNTTINDAIVNSSKTVTPINTIVGGIINYTIVLSNTGNATANNVVFIDTIPNGTSFVTNSFAINGTTQTGANPSPPGGVNIPNIAPNGVATLTFKVTVDTIPTTNPIPNSSTTNYTFVLNPATGATLPSSSSSNIVTTYVNPDSNPLKIVDKQYAVPGDILTYTVQWENRLIVTATDVVIIDTIPNDTSFVSNSITVNGVAVSGATIAPPSGLNIGTIPAGVYTTVTFKVTATNTIPSTNPILNQAMGRYSYISDPTLGTITTETAVSNTVSTQVNVASIPSATKSVNKTYATVGDVLTYTLSFTNIGNTTATNVNLIDTIPNDTTFVINSVFVNGVNQPGAFVAPPTGLSVGSLGINATATLVFQITVNTVPNPNPIPNIGFVSYNYVIDPIALTNGNGAVNTNIVNTQINYADFGIAGKTVNKTFGSIGDILTYTIVYTNTGNVTANNVIITDTIPNDTAFQASSVIINNTPNTTTVPVGNVLIISAGNVAPNGSATLSFKVKVTTAPNPNPIPNSASSSFTYTVDPALPNGVTSGNNTNTVNTQVNSASLGGITKFVDKAYAICGEIITYTISIPNSGNITATNVILSDTVPSGTVFISNSILVNGVQSSSTTPASISLGSIAPGATTTASFSVQVQC